MMIKRFCSVVKVVGLLMLLLMLSTPAGAVILENAPELYWDFNNYQSAEGSYADLIGSVNVYEAGGAVNTTTGKDGTNAVSFAGITSWLENNSTGMVSLVGAWAMEMDVWIPNAPPSAGQYVAGFGTSGMNSGPYGPQNNMEWFIYGFQGTELEIFGSPRTDGGPTTLNDGQWHTVVMASYGNAAGTQGYVDKLVYSVDGGALQAMTRESGNDYSALDLRSVGIGASNPQGKNPFTGAVDNFAVYDLSRSISEPSGNLETQLDAAVTAIATGQQRFLNDPADRVMPVLTDYGWSILKDNPRFYYSFNEPETNVAAQESVRLQEKFQLNPINNATRQDQGSANLGAAAVFDGTNDFTGTGFADGKMAGAWAVEFWMQVDGDLAGTRKEYLLNSINAGMGGNTPAVLHDYTDSHVELYGGGGRLGDQGPSINDNQWHHVVLTYYGDGSGNGVADRVDVALDGAVSTVDRGGFSVLFDLSYSLVVGAAKSGGIDGFEGKIDELACYDLSGLDESAVAAKVARLAAHYHLASQAAQPTLAYVDREGISYSYSVGPDPTGDDDTGRKLCDGIIGSITQETDSEFWVRFGNPTQDPNMTQAEMTFDLGGSATLDSIWIDYVGAGGLDGIAAPDQVDISFSMDGVTFGDLTTFTDFNDTTAAGDAYYQRRLIAEMSEMEAAFVKLSFFSDSEWIALGEVQFVEKALLPGDLNSDGFVGGDDLDIVRSFWGQSVDEGDLLQGDPSGDGFVGGDDLDIVRANWGQGTPPSAAAIPEPSTFALIATCILGVGVLRRRWTSR